MKTNPYKLPSGNVLISFSGGRTSGYMLHQILAVNGDLPERCKVVFANTGREMPETLDFVQECSERWNVAVEWLEYRRPMPKFKVVSHNSAARNGEPFKAALEQPKILPNVHRRFCTQELKVKTIKRYLVSIGWKQWTQCIGIRADEKRRVKASTEKRWINWYPLNDATATKQTVMEFWNAQPFDLRVMTGAGNCDGCFLKSEATLAAMWREHPSRMQWWAEIENWKSKQIGKKAHFHEKRTFEELGEFVARQSDWIFDDAAFLCQENDGECTS